MRKTESQRLHELLISAVQETEEIRAEGRFHPDHTGNRSYLIVTDRRIIWRHVGAAWDNPDRFPLQQIEFGRVKEVREIRAGGRAYFEMRLGRHRSPVFGFSRPDTAAAASIRARLRELGIPYTLREAHLPGSVGTRAWLRAWEEISTSSD